ncbi:Efflux transporter, RND family, MFP subunit [Acidisarcina polymorpha]|uniref:Efflux transporter, RND family, MFP subunit n=1 Tax=Acidisarcina polymorpha TaxID=2211140 RepID=A0A2Z5G5K0_9BACT|nr:efflux RND transporter periplasmic adaptor subunit [Acidisarcina polymorpha]AXC14219.1 Efflux transporter, RND family, MFP subunit [Acidisarcina polymorpha]
MDIARPDIKRKKTQRQVVIGIVAVLVLVGVAFAVSKLKPAAPSVERGTVWTDTVKRGPMLVQVRGLGTLVPREDRIRVVPAETDATVLRILVLPGAKVQPDTVIMELASPEAVQAAQDAALQLKEAEADFHNSEVKLQSDLMDQKSSAADIHAQYSQAQLQAKTDKSLYDLGVISGLQYSDSKGKADSLVTQDDLGRQKIEINEKALQTQAAVQRAKVDQARSLAVLKQRDVDALSVRAGINGVLVDIPQISDGHPLQVGTHVTVGTSLAKIVQLDQLKASLKIAETQARDILAGQPAEIDTHNGIIPGKVTRIDPAVQNGTVTVDVELQGALPLGARPDLSVDGTIDLERMTDVLFVGRPAFGNENSTISLFKVDPDGKGAVRVPVKVGRASVNEIQVLDGLHEGDTVILSDMSRWDNTDRIRLD